MVGRQVPPLLRFIRSIGSVHSEQEDTDSQLLERFRNQRDEAAFLALFRRHGPMVWSVCCRALGDSDIAEDAFQATFLVFVCKAGSIARPELLANYLYGIACRTVAGAKSRRARLRAREVQQSVDVAVEGHVEADWRELRPLLDEELERLPEKYRAPLVLCYLEGKTYGEAARLLGWPEGTVSGRLARARELLRHRLVRRGLVLSAGSLVAFLPSATPAAAIPASLEKAILRVFLGAVSSPVATLSKGVLHAMFLTKLKFAGTVILTTTLMCTGAGLTAQRVFGDRRPERANEFVSAAIPSPEPARNAQDAVIQVKTNDDKKDESPSATSPDRKWIAKANAKMVGLFDAGSGKEVRRLVGHEEKVTALAFTPDGNYLASGGHDKTVILWHVSTGKTLWKFTGNDAISSIEASKDGRTIIVREGANTKRNLDTESGKAVRGD
jgi:RNA polymerase sigma factor (sigma-70 family)